MRLKEDNTSWKSSGIKRRDFRHTHGEPEVPHHKSKIRKPRPKKNRHKHIWVEVEYGEWAKYTRHYPYWLYDSVRFEPPYWAGYTTYYVCCDCLDTKRKVDEGKRRAHYRRH